MQTLKDRFTAVLKKSGLTNVAFARRYGFSKTTISLLANGHKVGNSTIKQLVDLFGDEFSRYYEVTTCDICGKQFYAVVHNQIKCDNCSESAASHKPQLTRRERDPFNKKLAEVNQMARDAGMSYGQYQAMNRG